jgi:hypothetical protein
LVIEARRPVVVDTVILSALAPPVCNCTSEVWSFGLSRNDGEKSQIRTLADFGISEISLDGEVETGVSRFGPASSEGRFAIVTDVGGGMRWTRAALLTNGAQADGEVVWS